MCQSTDAHIDAERLERYALGTLQPPEVEGLEEHLLICSECQDRLEEADTYVRAMRRASAQLRGRAAGARPALMSWVAWAVALAVLALVGAAAIQWQRGPSTGPLPVALTLMATRSGEGVHAPSGKPLLLHLDLTGLPARVAWRLEIVDARGGPVWESANSAGDTRLTAQVPVRFRQGDYFVRLYSLERELMREFALHVGN